MLLAKKGIRPGIEDYHMPELYNITKNTVAIILASKGIIPEKPWIHDPDMKNLSGHTVASYLEKY